MKEKQEQKKKNYGLSFPFLGVVAVVATKQATQLITYENYIIVWLLNSQG